MRWEQGRETLQRMLDENQLQRVPASREQAELLLEQAKTHATSSEDICEHDPAGSYALLYDAARKALAAILQNEGLRSTSKGGHVAVYDAVRAQLDPPLGNVLRPFDWMRRQRNDVEYPHIDAPVLTSDDVRDDFKYVQEIIALAERVLDEMSPF